MWFLVLLLLAALVSTSGFLTAIKALLVPPAHLELGPPVPPVPKALQVRFPGLQAPRVLRGTSEPQALPVLPLRLRVRPVPPGLQAEGVHP